MVVTSPSQAASDAVMPVPEHERCWHEPRAATDLAQALSWATKHAPSDEALDETMLRLRHWVDLWAQ